MMSKSNLLKERGCVKNFLLARRFLSLLRELERKPSQGNSTSNLFRTLVISTERAILWSERVFKIKTE